MIVYFFCPAADAPRLLADGIKRADGRHYVFQDWADIQTLFAALYGDDTAEPVDHIALALNVDADMLMAGPLPRGRAPAGLPPAALEALQSRSAFLETDVNAQRIVDIKNGMGNSARSRFAPHKPARAPVWRFLAYVKPYWYFVATATLCGLVKFMAPLAFPWMLKIILDEVVLNNTLSVAEREQRVTQLTLTVLAVILAWVVATFFRSVFAAIAGHRMIRDLRVALFDHVQRLSHAFFARHQSGAIVSRVVNDISLAQNFVGSALTNVWMDFALLIALAVVLFSIHVRLALIALALMPFYVLSLRAIGARIRLSTREVQQRLEILSGGLQEKVAGMAIVKGFAREPFEAAAFTVQANKLLNKVMYSVRYMAANEIVVGSVVHTAPVLVAWYGARQILQNQLTVGELTQFLLYLSMFYFPLQRLSDLSVVLANSLAAIERIFEYFDTQPQVAEKPDALELNACRGRIEFDRVSFAYEPGRTVLHDIDLTIAPGETVAFVGPSGSGKSTLANLVPRFYDPTAGAIRVDGHDLRDLQLASLRHHIGIVNQDTVLFSGTVQDNLLLAKPAAGAAELLAALEAAHAREFVEELPEGLWTEIGERGVMLSGGQRQRIAIARAFLRNPRILILDEATSALDSRAEQHIQAALARLLENRTAIVIAHRLSTVINADRIVAIDGGRIIEIGNHHELLKRGGLYAQLYREQFRQPAEIKPDARFADNRQAVG